MKKENKKELEASLLKNIYKNLEKELQKFGSTKFINDDFGTKIEIEDIQNENLILILFQDNKLKITATYQFDYESDFNSSDVKKLFENNYDFSIFKGKLVIYKTLNDSNEIIDEIKNNIYQKF